MKVLKWRAIALCCVLGCGTSAFTQSQPVAPTPPAAPAQPTDPTQPTAPTDPTQPVDPPSDPSQPVRRAFVTPGTMKQSRCPNANPEYRKMGSTAPFQPPKTSQWNLQAIVDQMRHPTGYGGDSAGTAPLVLVTSHRGYWNYCPENTLESFQSAWDLGAESIEMDIRLSAKTAEYPNGEAFLSHDYDIRGEAPNFVDGINDAQDSNLIYSLTPAQIQARSMADRHGDLILSEGASNQDHQPLHMATLTQLLQSLYDRARALPSKRALVPGSGKSLRNCSTPEGCAENGHLDLLRYGAMLILDIKSLGAVTQLETFKECLREVRAFENAHHVDLSRAVAYKVQFADFTNLTYDKNGTPHYKSPETFISDLNLRLSVPAGAKEKDYLPKLIFIVFPADLFTPPGTITSGTERNDIPKFCESFYAAQKNAATKDTSICKPIAPADHKALNDWRDHYGGFLLNDWQDRNPNSVIEGYLASNEWNTWGVASFMASNNFAEGVRNSAGDCLSTFSLSAVNTSYCVSDPIQRWASASIDFLVPNHYLHKTAGNNGLLPSDMSHRATSVTTDQFENAITYLQTVGLDNTALIDQCDSEDDVCAAR